MIGEHPAATQMYDITAAFAQLRHDPDLIRVDPSIIDSHEAEALDLLQDAFCGTSLYSMALEEWNLHEAAQEYRRKQRIQFTWDDFQW